MPRGNGGIIGPANIPTQGSAKGVWSMKEIALAVRQSIWPFPNAGSDPYFNLTTLLLSTTSTNGQQNNTFLDGSTNNFTITRNGNTTQGTFSPFSQTGWGGAFNTSTTYLTVTDTANLRFGLSNFTIEAWVYRNASGATQTIASKGASTPTGWVFQINSADKLVFTDTSTSITGTTSIAANTWTYVAVVRAGTGTNQTTLYVNGTSDGTGTSATNFNQTSNMLVGADRSTTNFANGYISNLRLSNTNRTISSTPTTSLTADSNTIFLGLYNNRFQYTDSTAAFTNMSVTGTPSVQAFSPFNPTSAWSASTVGGSGYFDGTGDYLSVPDNAAFAFGTGDFTIEMWVYWNNVSSTQTLSDFRPNATGSSISPYIELTSSGTLIYYVGGATRITTSAVTATSWTHVALSRSGTSTKIFINGTQSGSTYTDSNSYVQSGATIGLNRNNGGVAFQYMNGYISNFRIVKGTAVYTGNFTPPTAPLTAITNTSLLLNFTNSGIYDATAKNVLETVGDAQASTAQSKWGGSSMSFDPTTGSATDYLQSPDTELLEFGSGNFTIETWVRFNTLPSSGAYYALISKFDNSTQKSYLFYVYNTVGTYSLYFTYTTNGSTNINPVAAITPSINTWYHYAVSRSGANLRMFIDGTQVGTTYNIATDTIFGGTYPVQVGASAGANTLNGYLQDLRVTKGYARYTANFTPPTAAFPVQ